MSGIAANNPFKKNLAEKETALWRHHNRNAEVDVCERELFMRQYVSNVSSTNWTLGVEQEEVVQ